MSATPPTPPTPAPSGPSGDDTARIVGKILHRAERDSRIIAAHLVGLAKRLTPIAVGLGIAVSALLAWFVVYDLGNSFIMSGDVLRPALTAFTMIVSILCMAGIVALTETSFTARGAALVFFVVWMALLVCVVALWSVLFVHSRGGELQTIPHELQIGGEIAYSVAPAINLIPLVVVGLIIARAPRDKHGSLFAASGDVLWTSAKGVGFVAGFAAEMYFGFAAGITPLYVVPAAFVIGMSFLATLGLYADAQRRRDRFDQRVWLSVGVVFLLYIVVVTFEAVNTFTVIGLNNGVMPQSHRDSFLFQVASTAYFASMPVFLVAFFASYIATSRIDDIEQVGAGGTAQRPRVNVVKPSLANRIGYTIGALATAKDEIRRGVAERRSLPAPQSELSLTQMASERDGEIKELSDAEDAGLGSSGKHNNNGLHSNNPPRRRERRTAAQVDAARGEDNEHPEAGGIPKA